MVAAVCILCILPSASAGTREDPKVSDPVGDVGPIHQVPYVDPAIDIVGVWFSDDAENLYIHMEVQAYSYGIVAPEPPFVHPSGGYSVNFLVDGKGAPNCPREMGRFGVSAPASGQIRGVLSSEYYVASHERGCEAGEVHQIKFEVRGDVLTWTVPKNVTTVQPGSVLEISGAGAADVRFDYVDVTLARNFTVLPAAVLQPEPMAPAVLESASVVPSLPDALQVAAGNVFYFLAVVVGLVFAVNTVGSPLRRVR
jgi:hypothetical protein